MSSESAVWEKTDENKKARPKEEKKKKGD